MYCTCGQSLRIEEPIYVLLVEILRLFLVETIVFLHYQQALKSFIKHCSALRLTRSSGTRLTSSIAPIGNLKLLQTGSVESNIPISLL